MKALSYQAAGVNVELGDRFVDRIKSLSRRTGHDKLLKAAGGYAAIYPLTENRYVALTTDGVGTKVLLAQQTGQHYGIGIDLVAMCANDLICAGATPTLFLDYFATGKLSLETGTQLIEGILDGCDQAGMLLVGGETAEMPDLYEPLEYDLAGFAVGEVTPDTLLTGKGVAPGQKVIGIASNGIHSNGLTLARKLLTSESDTGLLLTPTQIYVQPVLSLFKSYAHSITGVCHVTGGGWRNLFRLNQDVGFEISRPLAFPEVFERLLASGISPEEGYKTFNMGMGLAIVSSGNEEAMVAQLNAQGLSAQVVGEVTDATGRLIIPVQDIVLYPTDT